MFKLVKIESSVRVVPVVLPAGRPGVVGMTAETIKPHIYVIRGQSVMIDEDIAGLYGVEVKGINEKVRKNIMRFPDNYMFQLTDAEYDSLRSQIATLKRGERRKQPPHVFTERGVVMLSMILDSYKALEMSFLAVEGFTSGADDRPEAGRNCIDSILRKMAGIGNKQEKKYGFGTDENGNIIQEVQHAAIYGQQH
jgi:hypothetical protein